MINVSSLWEWRRTFDEILHYKSFLLPLFSTINQTGRDDISQISTSNALARPSRWHCTKYTQDAKKDSTVSISQMFLRKNHYLPTSVIIYLIWSKKLLNIPKLLVIKTSVRKVWISVWSAWCCFWIIIKYNKRLVISRALLVYLTYKG